MPFNRSVADKPLRIAQNSVTVVGANSDSPKATIFTVPIARKFTLYGVGTDQRAASVSLLAFHIVGTQSVALIDLPTQRLPTDEQMVPMFEVFNVGESLTVGLRNQTASPITPQLYVYYTDEGA